MPLEASPELAREIKLWSGSPIYTLHPLAKDGSLRGYYRILSAGKSCVVMHLEDAEAKKKLLEGHYDWLTLQRSFAAAGLPVPAVYGQAPTAGLLLIEDLGDLTFELVLRKATLFEQERLYHKALALVPALQSLAPKKEALWTTRAFTKEKLSYELGFFFKWYFADSLSQDLTLQSEVDRLATSLAQHPRYCTHRDFHSRNIMVAGETLALIDFQDAMLGPCAYDYASLIFDAYVPLDVAFRLRLLEHALELQHAHFGVESARDLELSWKPLLLQRGLKAIGSFAYLTAQKRGPYLRYVKPLVELLQQPSCRADDYPQMTGRLLQEILEREARNA